MQLLLKQQLTKYSFSDLGFGQKFSEKMKWFCPFKENKEQYLLPMIKLKVSSEN